MRILLLTTLVLTATLAGCLGGEGDMEVQGEETRLDASNTTLAKIESIAAPKRLKYVFPDQQERPAASFWVNGTVGPDAATAYEAPGNRGGTSYNTIIEAHDVSHLIPPGQPTLIEMRLWWNNGPGRGAKLDPYVNVPGTTSHESRAYADEWTWTLPVKETSLVTVGVPGETHEIGVQVANAKIAPGQEVQYTIRATFRYAEDVLTPYHPWSVDVPADASGLILGSVKHSGDVHVAAKVLVVGPEGDLVRYLDYNDLAVPTESVYIPVTRAGPHVLYAIDMDGGFLDVRADAGLDDHNATALQRVERHEVLVTDPLAPGTGRHVVFGTNVTTTEGGTEVAFDAGPTFPLEIAPFIGGGTTVTGDVDLTVTSSKGLVARYHRFLRYDDERGSIGWSDETGFGNRAFHPGALMKGEMTFRAVVDGSTGELGVHVVTYRE